MLRVIGIRFQFHLQTIKLFAITTYFMDLVKNVQFVFSSSLRMAVVISGVLKITTECRVCFTFGRQLFDSAGFDFDVFIVTLICLSGRLLWWHLEYIATGSHYVEIILCNQCWNIFQAELCTDQWTRIKDLGFEVLTMIWMIWRVLSSGI
jgi:hypothetical protein